MNCAALALVAAVPELLGLALPDGARIELYSFPDAPARPSYPEARGRRHLAFAVADVDFANVGRKPTV